MVRVVVPTDGSALGWERLISASGPDVGHGVTSSGLPAFLGLQPTHKGGLSIIFSLIETVSVVVRLCSQDYVLPSRTSLPGGLNFREWSCKGEGGR